MLLNGKLRQWVSTGCAMLFLAGVTRVSLGQVTLGQPMCGPSCNQQQCCEPSRNIWNCPPPYQHCQEGPPCIDVLFGCPKPVCCPIDAPNWGYFQTCWRPYPWAASWAHCYGVPPASQIMAPPFNSGSIQSMLPQGGTGGAQIVLPQTGSSFPQNSPLQSGSNFQLNTVPPAGTGFPTPSTSPSGNTLPRAPETKTTPAIPQSLVPPTGSSYPQTLLPPAGIGPIHSMPLQPGGDLPGLNTAPRPPAPQTLIRPGT